MAHETPRITCAGMAAQGGALFRARSALSSSALGLLGALVQRRSTFFPRRTTFVGRRVALTDILGAGR